MGSEKSEISNLWLGNEIEFKEDKDEPITHDEKNFHNVSHQFTNIDFKDKNLISEKSEITKLWSEKDEPIIDTKKMINLINARSKYQEKIKTKILEKWMI